MRPASGSGTALESPWTPTLRSQDILAVTSGQKYISPFDDTRRRPAQRSPQHLSREILGIGAVPTHADINR